MSELSIINPISIRRATALDYCPLLELFDEIDGYHRVQLPHLFKIPAGPAREQEFFQGILHDENAAFFIAECIEGLIGFIHVYIKETPLVPIMVPRKYAVIDTLMVKSGYKRLGVGRLLMQTGEDWAKTQGATSVVLSVYEFNQTAISFYEKVGFHTLSRRMEKEL